MDEDDADELAERNAKLATAAVLADSTNYGLHSTIKLQESALREQRERYARLKDQNSKLAAALDAAERRADSSTKDSHVLDGDARRARSHLEGAHAEIALLTSEKDRLEEMLARATQDLTLAQDSAEKRRRSDEDALRIEREGRMKADEALNKAQAQLRESFLTSAAQQKEIAAKADQRVEEERDALRSASERFSKREAELELALVAAEDAREKEMASANEEAKLLTRKWEDECARLKLQNASYADELSQVRVQYARAQEKLSTLGKEAASLQAAVEVAGSRETSLETRLATGQQHWEEYKNAGGSVLSQFIQDSERARELAALEHQRELNLKEDRLTEQRLELKKCEAARKAALEAAKKARETASSDQAEALKYLKRQIKDLQEENSSVKAESDRLLEEVERSHSRLRAMLRMHGTQTSEAADEARARYGRAVEEAKEERDKFKETNAELKMEINRLGARLEQELKPLKENVRKLEKDVDEKIAEAQQLTIDLTTEKRTSTRLRKDLELAQESAEANERFIEAIQAAHDAAVEGRAHSRMEHQHSLGNAQQEVVRSRGAVKEMAAKVEAASKEVQALNAIIEQLEKQHVEDSETLANVKREHSATLQRAREEAEHRGQNMQSDIDEEARKLRDSNNTILTLERRTSDLEQRESLLAADKTELEKQVTLTRNALRDSDATTVQLKAEVSRLQSALGNCEEHLASVRDEHASTVDGLRNRLEESRVEESDVVEAMRDREFALLAELRALKSDLTLKAAAEGRWSRDRRALEDMHAEECAAHVSRAEQLQGEVEFLADEVRRLRVLAGSGSPTPARSHVAELELENRLAVEGEAAALREASLREKNVELVEQTLDLQRKLREYEGESREAISAHKAERDEAVEQANQAQQELQAERARLPGQHTADDLKDERKELADERARVGQLKAKLQVQMSWLEKEKEKLRMDKRQSAVRPTHTPASPEAPLNVGVPRPSAAPPLLLSSAPVGSHATPTPSSPPRAARAPPPTSAPAAPVGDPQEAAVPARSTRPQPAARTAPQYVAEAEMPVVLPSVGGTPRDTERAPRAPEQRDAYEMYPQAKEFLSAGSREEEEEEEEITTERNTTSRSLDASSAFRSHFLLLCEHVAALRAADARGPPGDAEAFDGFNDILRFASLVASRSSSPASAGVPAAVEDLERLCAMTMVLREAASVEDSPSGPSDEDVKCAAQIVRFLAQQKSIEPPREVLPRGASLSPQQPAPPPVSGDRGTDSSTLGRGGESPQAVAPRNHDSRATTTTAAAATATATTAAAVDDVDDVDDDVPARSPPERWGTRDFGEAMSKEEEVEDGAVRAGGGAREDTAARPRAAPPRVSPPGSARSPGFSPSPSPPDGRSNGHVEAGGYLEEDLGHRGYRRETMLYETSTSSIKASPESLYAPLPADMSALHGGDVSPSPAAGEVLNKLDFLGQMELDQQKNVWEYSPPAEGQAGMSPPSHTNVITADLIRQKLTADIMDAHEEYDNLDPADADDLLPGLAALNAIADTRSTTSARARRRRDGGRARAETSAIRAVARTRLKERQEPSNDWWNALSKPV